MGRAAKVAGVCALCLLLFGARVRYFIYTMLIFFIPVRCVDIKYLERTETIESTVQWAVAKIDRGLVSLT